jgi:hypothetical protein
MDDYGWRKGTQEEIDALEKEMHLARIFHSVADCSIWYLTREVDGCRNYMECTPYARRWELDDDPKSCYINQKNVDAWRAR